MSRDPAGIWVGTIDGVQFEDPNFPGLTEASEDKGACQGSQSFTAAQSRAFQFDGKGGVNFDASRLTQAEREGCMSFGALGCPLPKGNLQSVEFTVSTSGCLDPKSDSRNVWACPLWMTPAKWGPDQVHSGEIDFVERCGLAAAREVSKSGMAFNFGHYTADPRGPHDFPIDVDLSSPHTMFVAFDHELDQVRAYVCPESVKPTADLKAGRGISQQCKLLGTDSGYFARTKHASDAENTMHFVTDVWNSTGACAMPERTLNGNCKYSVSDIQVTMDSSFNPDTYLNWNHTPACKQNWYAGTIPASACGSDFLTCGNACNGDVGKCGDGPGPSGSCGICLQP